jgi:uncharacterized RDD family membrane protein YckC
VVDLDDTIAIVTPEGLALDLRLAGVGSRFIAGATDLIIQIMLAAILVLVTRVLAGGGGLLAVVAVIGLFIDLLLYPILFEVLGHGRTPGKRLTHLRVLRSDGSPVDLQASAIRNLMRLIDGEPLLYLPTLVSIAVTRHNQRPGDLAAATIVIREPAGVGQGRRRRGRTRDRGAERASEPEVAWDTSAVTAQELAAVRRFLDRRETLDPMARRMLARRLASALRERVTGAPPELGSEPFLEAVARARGR